MAKQKEKTQSKFQILLMIVIVPFIFALILAVVLLYYLGFNITDSVKNLADNLPFIESEEEGEDISDEEYIIQLENENESQAQRIAELEQELAAVETDFSELEEDLSDLTSDETVEGEEADQALADFEEVIRTLQEMTASKAAVIIEEMPEQQAVLYLRAMNVNARADILGRVDAELAASILTQISN